MACIGIGSRNGRVPILGQTRHRLREDMVWIKIRVMAVVAITSPPTGIDGKLRQVGEPMSDLGSINSRRGATHQSAKPVQNCRSRSLGNQVRVEELVMSDLIIGVVMDVLIHVFVRHREGLSIVWIAMAAWDFVILDAAEFVVLNPKVGLDYLQSRWEAK